MMIGPGVTYEQWFYGEFAYRSALVLTIFTVVRLIPYKWLSRWYYYNTPVRFAIDLENAFIFATYYFGVAHDFMPLYQDTWTLYILFILAESYGGFLFAVVD